MPRSPIVIAGVCSSTIPESKTIAQSAPRSSARTQCATASPPVSSSPSTSTRTLTGSVPGRRLLAGDVQQRQEVALVVGRAARVDAPVADVGREGRGGPRVEVADGLNVVVAVDEDGRRALARGLQLAHGQRVALGGHDARLAADGAHAPGHPGGRALEVGRVAAARRDRWDPQPVHEVVEQALVHAAGP